MKTVSISETKIFSTRLLGRLKGAQSVVVLTGAGGSAEPGISTFRDPDGLWANFKPEELATPEAFKKNPKMVWEWYAWRREKIKLVRPNPGHYALPRESHTSPRPPRRPGTRRRGPSVRRSKNVLEL